MLKTKTKIKNYNSALSLTRLNPQPGPSPTRTKPDFYPDIDLDKNPDINLDKIVGILLWIGRWSGLGVQTFSDMDSAHHDMRKCLNTPTRPATNLNRATTKH